MKSMKRPVEWGGNASDISKEELLQHKIDVKTFLRNGVLRRLYTDFQKNDCYRLTAPGYLMYERMKNGFLLEVVITKGFNHFNVDICDATDKEEYFTYTTNKNITNNAYIKNEEIISYLKKCIIIYKNRGGFV